MPTLFLFLYLLAGVAFGLAAANESRTNRLIALGLLLWVSVEVIRTLQNL